jgi:NitT/TauT family transport system substrate-binding protein
MLPATARAADQKVTVRMDWVISGYHAPFFVGVKNGYYTAEGLDVTVEPGNGSANVAQAIGHGNGTFGTVDGGTMMQLVAKGLPVKAVMGWLQRNPIAVLFNQKSGIKTPKDLVGKTVAIHNGDAPAALLPAFAKASGIDLAKMNTVSVAPAAKAASVISGRADATISFGFLDGPVIAAAGVDVGQLLFADYGVDVPGLSVIASTSFIAAHPDVVRKFDRATRKAMAWTEQHPKEAIDILADMNPGQKIDKTISLSVLKASFKLLHSKRTKDEPIGVMSAKDWASAQDLLAEYVGLRKMPSVDAYFTNAFATAKAAERPAAAAQP